jgi:hypothetical protein
MFEDMLNFTLCHGFFGVLRSQTSDKLGEKDL